MVDSRWVVPYNAGLLLKYNCHCNAEICQSMSSSKYLFKYVLKRPDMAMMNVVEQGQVLDECTQYQSTHVVGSGEAAHRLFGFLISKAEPSVMKLQTHLENEQQVMFEDGHE